MVPLRTVLVVPLKPAVRGTSLTEPLGDRDIPAAWMTAIASSLMYKTFEISSPYFSTKSVAVEELSK